MLGLRLYSRASSKMGEWITREGVEARAHLLRAVVYLFAAPVAGFFIRIFSTVYCLASSPLYALRQMPWNWIQQSLIMDFAYPPEVMPGEALFTDLGPTFLTVMPLVRRQQGFRKAVVILVIAPIIVLGWLPAALYRISFKATSLAYAPLVWVARTTLQTDLSEKGRLERFTKGELEKARRWYSGIVLTIMAAKVGVMLRWVAVAQLLAQIPSQTLIDKVIEPAKLPWWQITLLSDAVLTYLLLWFADAAIRRIDDAHPWPENVVEGVTSGTSYLRAVLGILTISHFLYLALVAVARSWHLPTL